MAATEDYDRDFVGCPGALASALANAVLLRIKESDLRDVRRNNLNAEGATQQELEPIKLFSKVTDCMEDVLVEWQRASDADLRAIATQMEAVSVFAIKNGRRKMEDRHVVIQDLNQLFGIKEQPRTSFYAVFDGHAGTDAAVYSTVHLHCNIVNHPSYLQDLPTAIKEGFTKTDLDFIAKSTREELKSGSTALACLLRGRQLHLAWLGDSQAILVRGGKPVYNMVPHKPDREDEKRRIENAGGCVIFFGTWRVNGTLAVSRAIGDTDYKPYVCSDADIETIDLDGSEDFVVLACDGLWDVLQADDVVDLVYKHLAKQPDDVNGVAAHLVQIAKERGSSDNITVIVVFLRDVSEWPLHEVANATVQVQKEQQLDYVDVLSLNEHHQYSETTTFAASTTTIITGESAYANGKFDDFHPDAPFVHDSSTTDADFSGDGFGSAVDALDFSGSQFSQTWGGDAVLQRPASVSTLDSSAPEFVPSSDKAAVNPFAMSEFDSPNVFGQSATGDNPFFQPSSEPLQGGGDRYGFEFSSAGQMIDMDSSEITGSPWSSNVRPQEVPFGSEIDDLMQPSRPVDLDREHGLDHAALVKSTLSPDAEPFVMGDRASPFVASSGGGSERSVSTPLSETGDHDFMLPSLQPTAPPAELTPRRDNPEVKFGEQPDNDSSALSSPLEEQRPSSFPSSPVEEQRPTSFPASPSHEDRPSFPESPLQEERPSSFPASPVHDKRPTSFPVSRLEDHQPSSFPSSPSEELRPSSFPASPLEEQRPLSFSASPLEEQRPSPFPASPLEEQRPSSFPASPLEEQRPSSFPDSPLEEQRPLSFPASPVQEQGFTPALPVRHDDSGEQQLTSFPSSPIEEQRSSSFPVSPIQEQQPSSFPASPLQEERRISPESPVQHNDIVANDLQMDSQTRGESLFDAFLGQRSDAVEALPDTLERHIDHHEAQESDESALLSFGVQAEPERAGHTLLSPSTRYESEVQFTESLVKDDLHTVYTAGESPMTINAMDRENSAGLSLNFMADQQVQSAPAPSQYEIPATFDLVAEQEPTRDILGAELLTTTEAQRPAEVSADSSGVGNMLGDILDSAPVAEDVEDADSEDDDDEWRFHPTGATESVPAEQQLHPEVVQPAAVEPIIDPTESVDLIPKIAPAEVQLELPLVAAAAAAAATTAAVDVSTKPVAAKRGDPPKSAAAANKTLTGAAKSKSAPAAASRSAPAGKATAAAKPAAAARPKVSSATTTKPLTKPSESVAKKTASTTLAKKPSEPLKVTGSAAASLLKAKPSSTTAAPAAAKLPSKPTARAASAPTATAAAAKKPLTTAAKVPAAASTTTRRAVTATTTTIEKKTATDGAASTAAPSRRPAPTTKTTTSVTATKTDGVAKVDIKQTKETANKQISGITKRTVTTNTTTAAASKTTVTNGVGSRSSPAAPKPLAARSSVTTTTTTTKTTVNGNTNGTSGLATKTTTTTTRGVPSKTTKTVTSSATAAYGSTRTPPAKPSAAAKSPAKTETPPVQKLSRTSTPKSTSPNKAASLANGRKAPATKTPTHSGSTAKVAVTKRNTKAAAATNEETGNEKGSLDAVAKETVPPTAEDIMQANGNKNDVCTSDLVRTADEQFDTNGSDYHHSGTNGSYNADNVQSEGDAFLA